MKFVTAGLAALAASMVSAASWSFQDASLSIQAKGAGADATAIKEKFSAASPLKTALPFKAADTLKLSLTTLEGKSPARPHQIFLTLTDPLTNLEDSFPLDIKESGKAKLDLTLKDIPTALLKAPTLAASLTIGSFGSGIPFKDIVFSLSLPEAAARSSSSSSSAAATAAPTAPVDSSDRYAPLPTITHVFRPSPKSPNIVITAVFTVGVVLVLPVLLGAWEGQGLNFKHMSEAFGRAPLAYASFLGAIVGLEGAFAMYYVSWTLFQLLPVAAVLGTVGFIGGAKALREVQERRLAGKR